MTSRTKKLESNNSTTTPKKRTSKAKTKVKEKESFYDEDYKQEVLDHLKASDTKIYALGGLNEVGKNMYCFEHEDEIIVVDSGILFPEDDLLGVDYVIPDYTYLKENRDKFKALIITHGHEDHIGGIPFLMQSLDIPVIYASSFAAELIRRKLDDRKITTDVKIIEVDENSSVKTKYFTVGFFSMIHSIPGSYGVIITTDNGRIISTGDFKFDLTPIAQNADYQKLAFLGEIGVNLLMSDSTNSFVDGFSVSEKKVANNVMDLMKKTPGRLIVSTFASNVIRLNQILEAAIKYDRKVAVFGRSMENVVEIGRHMGTIKLKDSDFVSGDDLPSLPANKVCIVCTGSQGESLAALNRIANGTHKHIKIIPGDTVVFSSNPIPGNTQNVNALINALTRVGASVIYNSPQLSLHTTGHASESEQKLLLQLVKPKYFMPMHGEYKMLKKHMASAVEVGIPEQNCFICNNGDVLALRDGTVYRTDVKVTTDDIYVDGNDISGLNTSVIKDRQLLADNGLVAVVVGIDSRTNTIISRPNIVSRGFVFIKESQTLLKEAEHIVLTALRAKMTQRVTFNEIKNTIRSSLEPYLFKKTNRNPIIIPVILNHKDAMAEMQKRAEARKSAAAKKAEESVQPVE